MLIKIDGQSVEQITPDAIKAFKKNRSRLSSTGRNFSAVKFFQVVYLNAEKSEEDYFFCKIDDMFWFSSVHPSRYCCKERFGSGQPCVKDCRFWVST